MQRLHETTALPGQPLTQNVKTNAHPHSLTMRTDFKRVLTTGFAGKFLPVFAIPLLREDRMQMTTFRLGLEMAETAAMLANPVRVAARLWFCPKLAFERYDDLGQLNRSYLGRNEADGSPLPWFQTVTIDDGAGTDPTFEEVAQTMGLHTIPGSTVNADYFEAYNAIWNYMAAQVSPSLTPRTEHDMSLAPAFWQHSVLRHVKPTFDQALIHGEVPLNVVESQLQVTGIGVRTTDAPGNEGTWKDSTGSVTDDAFNLASDVGRIRGNTTTGLPEIFAELQQDGITVSLANLDLARKTSAFARARQAYQGLGDDEIIDLLMQGVRIPDEGLKQPMLIGEANTVFGMSQRYATDSGNLEKSVTRGQTVVDLRGGVPRTNTGGIVMCTVEIVPEQMYERRADQYLHCYTVANLPDRMRDELDVEPVEIVTNAQIDVDHTTPSGVFGYAPLNHKWIRDTPNIGGLYHRPRADQAWNEYRNRVWAVEQIDPTLGDDFYLASNIHHQVFEDALTDPFEITAVGLARIEGLTYFGPALRESTGDYDAVYEKADTSRITLA